MTKPCHTGSRYPFKNRFLVGGFHGLFVDTDLGFVEDGKQ